MGDNAYPTTKLTLVVIRVANLDRARSFYAALGLPLHTEQHEGGPRHYACTIDGLVLELYPFRNRQAPSTLRLGFQISPQAFDRMSELGYVIHPLRRIRALPRDVYLVRDPDGNSMELEVEVELGMEVEVDSTAQRIDA